MNFSCGMCWNRLSGGWLCSAVTSKPLFRMLYSSTSSSLMWMLSNTIDRTVFLTANERDFFGTEVDIYSFQSEVHPCQFIVSPLHQTWPSLTPGGGGELKAKDFHKFLEGKTGWEYFWWITFLPMCVLSLLRSKNRCLRCRREDAIGFTSLHNAIVDALEHKRFSVSSREPNHSFHSCNNSQRIFRILIVLHNIRCDIWHPIEQRSHRSLPLSSQRLLSESVTDLQVSVRCRSGSRWDWASHSMQWHAKRWPIRSTPFRVMTQDFEALASGHIVLKLSTGSRAVTKNLSSSISVNTLNFFVFDSLNRSSTALTFGCFSLNMLKDKNDG